MRKAKAIAIVAVTAVMLFGLAVWSLALPDRAVSRAERRRLAQAPAPAAQTVFSGKYMEDLETYLLDQFPGREGWRRLQAAVRFYGLRQKDSHGVYLSGGSVQKLEYPLKEDQVRYAAKKIEEVRENYLQNANVRWAVAPDKGFYAAAAGGYPHMDYDRLLAVMQETVDAPYVDLTGLLDLEDYYRTDAHWRQEALLPAAQALADAFGLGADLTPAAGFTAHTLEPFYGVYCGQAALPIPLDALIYLTSPAIDAASMTGLELEGAQPVYAPEKFSGMDGYDVFAAGPQAILTIESPLARTDRELVIFRDSFGSSLAPLFLEGYARVTLIDLRYVPAKLLPEYVTLDDQDVLFLYSTTLLNSGMLLK